ncbi:hypothetical protein ACVIHH_003694 [Bradyrhizobium sp. USDA 4518]
MIDQRLEHDLHLDTLEMHADAHMRTDAPCEMIVRVSRNVEAIRATDSGVRRDWRNRRAK